MSERIIKRFLCLIALSTSLFSVTSPYAQERIGFEAEHTIESAMNARYLALPWIPGNTGEKQVRLQTGYNQVSASLFGGNTLMLGLEYFLPASTSGGYLFSVFGDFTQYNGSSGQTSFDPAFIINPPFNTPLTVNVTDTNGHAEHFGISASRVSRISRSQSWQYGGIIEYYNVGKFAVAFDSVSPGNSFSAVVDYAATYITLTPYISYKKTFSSTQNGLKYAARVIAAWPLPRQGFEGRLSFSGFDQSGSTDDVGNGTHIPDPYAAIGFAIKPADEKWQFDIGASLYFLLTEGLIHEGIDSPIVISFTWQL